MSRSKDQLEINVPGDDFRLVSERTQDGERITREHEQRESDRAESEKNQTNLFE